MNKRRAGVLASYAYSISQVIVNLIYVPLLLGGIGQSEYGLYQMIGSMIAYLSIVNSTFSAGATRFYCKYYALGDTEKMANTLGILKRIYRIAYIFVFAITFILMGIVSTVYKNTFSAWEIQESCVMLAVLALNLVLTMNNTVSIACITAHEEFTFLKLSQLVMLVLQPLLILIFIQFQPFAFTITLVQLFCNFLLRVVQQLFARTKLGMDDHLRFIDKGLEKQIVAFSGAMVLGVIADQVFWKTDQLIIGYMYGTSAVAIYSVGSQIVNAYSPLGFAVSSVFMPKVSELWHAGHDIKAISNLFLKVSRVALYPLLAVLLGFVIFGQDFIRLWAGDGFGMAYWVALLEMIPFTIDISQNIGLTILQVMNRYGFRAKMYFAAAIFNIALTIVLARWLGIAGAAVASGVAILVSSGFVLNWFYQVRVGLNMSAWWKSVLREIIPMIVLCAIGRLAWGCFSGGDWGSLICGVACWAVAFALTSYFLCANDSERSLVRGFVKRFHISKR